MNVHHLITESQAVIFILVMARVSSFVAFFPLFSRRQLPRLVKLGLAVALSFFWLDTVAFSSGLNVTAELDLSLVGYVILVVKEILIGIMLATILGLFFLPAKIAGAYVGQELGLSLAAISDPGAQDSSTLLSRIFEAIAILTFFSLNLHHFVILAIHVSLSVLFGQIDLLTLPTEDLVSLLNDVTDFGFLIIAPIAILFMIIVLALAFLTKAAPTLNVFSIGMPLRIGVGVLFLLMFFPVIMGSLQSIFFRIQDDIEYIMTTFLP